MLLLQNELKQAKDSLLSPEFLSGDLFHLCNCFHDLIHDLVINFSSVFIVLRTSFCCDREAPAELEGQGLSSLQGFAFPPEKVSHVGVTLSLNI